MFGTGRPDAGWLFGATCDAVEPGAVVRFILPAGQADGPPAIGRITAVEPGFRLVLRHEAPWPGQVTCTLTPHGQGTRVRVVAEIEDEAIRWLLRRGGVELPTERETGGLMVGALISQSGPASVYTRPASAWCVSRLRKSTPTVGCAVDRCTSSRPTTRPAP